MTVRPAGTAWFARHEFSLAWRDWLALMTGGKPVRTIIVLAILVGFVVALHWVAEVFVAPWAKAGVVIDKPTVVTLTGAGFLFFTVMLSQAIESVTRAYYARADLDLILSSPASSRRLFAVRTSAIALGSMLLACLLASPLVNVLVYHLGPTWLAAYGVLAALAAVAVALAVLITIALFRLVGPRRTRLIAQIVAGIVGAGFIIGIQAAAILSYGTLSRFAVFQSEPVIAAAPALDSPLWWPARAATGDLPALLAVAVIAFGLLALVIATTSKSFGQHAIAAAGSARAIIQHRRRDLRFRPATQRQALRRKEWKLLRRDPWLLSQTLMQVLYLLPPALMLWLNYGNSAGIMVVITPVIVMASGQLAGGLAWLAISGEDAHDLVVSAPVIPISVLIAKIEAVTGALALVLSPLLLLIAIADLRAALIAGLGAALAAASSTTIQLWFRVQARRALFRRRQVSSRIATISEAFASVMWAAAAALVLGGGLLAIVAVVPIFLALAIMLIVWLVRPRRA